VKSLAIRYCSGMETPPSFLVLAITSPGKGSFYDEPYLRLREEKHLIYLGMLPEIDGLYKKDEAKPPVDVIVLSHPHADHWDYILWRDGKDDDNSHGASRGRAAY